MTVRDQQQAGSQLLEGVEAGHDEDDLHRIGVLAQERAPAGFHLARGQPVGTEPPRPRSDLRGTV